MALAAILGGAGLGLGLTSLYAQSRADRVAHADDSSIEVRLLRRNIIVRARQVEESPARAQVVHHALIVESDRSGIANEVTPSFRLRTRVRRSRSERGRQQLGTLRGQVEDIRLEAREMVELKERLFEVLTEVEALEDLDLDEIVTIELRRDDDDERRRRRRRRRPR
jgi:hypothetical protein